MGAHFKALDELVFMAPSEFFGIFLTTERHEVVLFLEYSWAAAYEVSFVRDVVAGKLSYFLEIWNETWW